MNMVDQFHKVLFRRGENAGAFLGIMARVTAWRVPGFMPACETLLGIALILLLASVLPGQAWGLMNVHPHPLWIVALAIAVRYGAAPGYLAGGLSALTYGLLLWADPAAQSHLITPDDFIQAYLMFVAGAAVGELVDARERRVADLQARSQAAENALESLRQQQRGSESVRIEMEKQIAFQANSVATLSALGQRLQCLHVAELDSAIVALVASLLEADRCALYSLTEEWLLMKAACPDGPPIRAEAGPARPWVLSTRHPLVGRAIRERRVVTIRDQLLQDGSQSIAHEAILMAGPLTVFGDQVYGVVVIEAIAFIKFTPFTINCFEMILGWASRALENALLYERAVLKPEGCEPFEAHCLACGPGTLKADA